MSPISGSSAYYTAAYIRIASLSIAGFDYVQNISAAWRFYQVQRSYGRITLTAFLFFLIRLTSITVLVISSFLFFYPKFTLRSCSRVYLLPGSFKVVQGMASQAILGVRAYNLSRRSKRIGITLSVIFIITCLLQWVTSLYRRIPQIDYQHGNCRAISTSHVLGAWIYYVVAVLYDLSATFISVAYLLKYKFTTTSSLSYKLTKMMLYDGLGYFAVLTGVNVLNLIMWRTSEANVQSAAVSLGYAVTWIMSQRLLIHLHDAALQRRNQSINEVVTITQNLATARDISRAIRSQFESKSGGAFDLTVPDFDAESQGHDSEPEHGVSVRIERTVKLEHNPQAYELENYTHSGLGSRDLRLG